MSARILDGKAAAAAVRADVRSRAISPRARRRPSLAVVLVGDDPASRSTSEEAPRRRRALAQTIRLPATTAQSDLAAEVAPEQPDPRTVQLPLPKASIRADRRLIDPRRTSTGSTPRTSPRSQPGRPYASGCPRSSTGTRSTSRARTRSSGADARGKPLDAAARAQRDGDDRAQPDPHLARVIGSADLVFAAIGSPRRARRVDPRGRGRRRRGINRVPDGKGAFRSWATSSSPPRGSVGITPVPGGIGR
jgi:methylenetetrahydrofolate dehydrogenase (NADP+)/methenyltetrahydrofolate cyclohydrolase